MVPDFLRQPHGVVIVFEEVWVSLAILQKSDVGESLGGGLVQVLGFGLQTQPGKGVFDSWFTFLPKLGGF